MKNLIIVFLAFLAFSTCNNSDTPEQAPPPPKEAAVDKFHGKWTMTYWSPGGMRPAGTDITFKEGDSVWDFDSNKKTITVAVKNGTGIAPGSLSAGAHTYALSSAGPSTISIDGGKPISIAIDTNENLRLLEVNPGRVPGQPEIADAPQFTFQFKKM